MQDIIVTEKQTDFLKAAESNPQRQLLKETMTEDEDPDQQQNDIEVNAKS